MSTSGYTECACFECFELAISNDTRSPDLCQDCDEAGCTADGCEAPYIHLGDNDQ